MGCPGEVLGEEGGGAGEARRIGFFYPTASPTVSSGNGTDSHSRHFPSVPSHEEKGRAGPRACQQTWRGRSGKM